MNLFVFGFALPAQTDSGQTIMSPENYPAEKSGDATFLPASRPSVLFAFHMYEIARHQPI